MPLSDKITLPDGSSVFIWNIEETETALESMYVDIDLEDHELETVKSYKIARKRKQWYAARLLSAASITDFKGIYYDQFGAPHLVESDRCVSYSHSYDKVAMIIHDDCEVGIDIQKEDPKIKRIVTKFLNESEMKRYDKSNKDQDMAHVIWSVKESIFKIHKHHLPFKDIKTAAFKNNGQGEMKVKAERFDGLHEHTVHFHKLKDYFLAHSCYVH